MKESKRNRNERKNKSFVNSKNTICTLNKMNFKTPPQSYTLVRDDRLWQTGILNKQQAVRSPTIMYLNMQP